MRKTGLLRILAETIPVVLVIGALALATVLAIAMQRRSRPAQRPELVRAETARAATPPPAEPGPPTETTAAFPKFSDELIEAELVQHRLELDEEAARLREADARAVRAREAVQEARGRVASQKASLDQSRTRLERLEKVLGTAKSELLRAQALNANRAWQRDQMRRSQDESFRRAKDSHAVMPLKGRDGTWRQPIVIDCLADGVRVLPGGSLIRMDAMSSFASRRSHPLPVLVRRRTVELEETPTPDGAPAVAYVLFLVRPDGIRAFYEARALLEPMGMAFGYELINADWSIEVPEPQRTQQSNRNSQSEPKITRSGGDAGVSGDSELYVWTTPEAGKGDRPGTSVADAELGPSGEFDLMELLGSVPDPRRVTGLDSASDGLEGYTEIIPGQRPREHDSEGAGLTGERESADIAPAGESQSAGPLARRDMPARAGETGWPSVSQRAEGAGKPPTADATNGNTTVATPGWVPQQALGASPDEILGSLGRGDAGGDRNPASRPLSPLVEGVGSVSGHGGGNGGRDRNPGAHPVSPLVGGVGSASGNGGGNGGGEKQSEGGPGRPWGAGLPSATGASGTLLNGTGATARGPARDVTIHCLRDEILIQPGGYRISKPAIESTDLLIKRLKYLGETLGASARLRFVVEPAGEPTFWAARRQTMFADLEWPTVLQVVEGSSLRSAIDAPRGR